MNFIIFLDIDGVLNQLQPWRIDNACVKNLGLLAKTLRTNKVVLTSSWRRGWSRDIAKCTPQVQSLIKALKAEGIEIIGRTRIIGDRLAEVQDYCAVNNIRRYIILDDDKSEFSKSVPNLYIVNSRTGLTPLDVKAIKRICK